MGQHSGLLHVQAHQGGGLLVAAHRIEAAAELGVAQHQEGDQGHDQGNDHGDADIGGNQHALLVQIRADAEGDLALDLRQLSKPRLKGHADLLGGNNRRHAPGEEQARHSDDEGLNFQVGDAEALNRAKDHADEQNQRNQHAGGHSPLRQAHGHEHTGHSHHGAYGNVDTAGEHHAGDAAGHNNQAGVVDHDVQEILESAEFLVRVHKAARAVEEHEQRNGNHQHHSVAADSGLFSVS